MIVGEARKGLVLPGRPFRDESNVSESQLSFGT